MNDRNHHRNQRRTKAGEKAGGLPPRGEKNCFGAPAARVVTHSCVAAQVTADHFVRWMDVDGLGEKMTPASLTAYTCSKRGGTRLVRPRGRRQHYYPCYERVYILKQPEDPSSFIVQDYIVYIHTAAQYVKQRLIEQTQRGSLGFQRGSRIDARSNKHV